MWFGTSRPKFTTTQQEVYYHPSAIFMAKIANLHTIFYGPKLQTLHSTIFVDQNCKPFKVQFFWQKLQTF